MEKRDILTAMELAGLAYGPEQATAPTTLLTVIDDPNSDIQCYLRRWGDLLAIAFRGTDSPWDWHTDFMFWQKTIPYGNTASKIRVHAGFIRAYNRPEVRGRIHSMITGDLRRVFVTGHSYGAALAVLCGVDLQYNFPDRDYEVMLFGCPRVGNRAFAKSYNKRVFKTVRVENGNDIVTKIPFAMMNYRHVGAPVHIGPMRLPLIFSPLDHRPRVYYGNLLGEFV